MRPMGRKIIMKYKIYFALVIFMELIVILQCTSTNKPYKKSMPEKPIYDQYLGKSLKELELIMGSPSANILLSTSELEDELRQVLLQRIPKNVTYIKELQFANKQGVTYVWIVGDEDAGRVVGDAIIPAGIVF